MRLGPFSLRPMLLTAVLIAGTFNLRAASADSSAPIPAAAAASLPDSYCDSARRAECQKEAQRLWKAPVPERNPARAAELFALLCRSGDAAACVSSGDMSRSGDGTALSAVAAAGMYQKGCDGGQLGACVKLGELLRDGVKLPPGVTASLLGQGAVLSSAGGGIGEVTAELPRDGARALALFEAACRQGEQAACTDLGFAYDQGADVKQDRKRSAALFGSACTAGDGKGCLALGRYAASEGHWSGGQIKQAVALLDARCAAGQGSGCYGLGVYYRDLPSAKQQRQKIFALYQKACDLDYLWGCHDLGIFFDEDTLGGGSPVKALPLFAKACAEAHTVSCLNLADMYARGRPGIPIDRPKAVAAAERGCGLGDANTCRRLGYYYLEEAESPQAKHGAAQALALFEQECQRRDAGSCNKVAIMAMKGQGQPRNPQSGQRHFRAACALGEAMACTNFAVMQFDEKTDAQLRDEKLGMEYLARGCQMQDARACELLKQLQGK